MVNKVLTLGEALVDLVSNKAGYALKDVSSFEKAAGGAPANVAVSVAKLGLQSCFIGKLSYDAFGDFLLQTLREEGVSDLCISRTPSAKTGIAFVSLKADGDRDFMFYRDPSADMLLSANDIQKEWFNKGDIFHFGSISLIQSPSKEATLTAIEYARERGALISFDPNIRELLWPNMETAKNTILEYMKYTDILKISEVELEILTGKSTEDGLKDLFKGNIKLILLTLGNMGSIAYTKENKIKVNAFEIRAVDTTGAGDSFIAGVLYKLIKNKINIDNFENSILKESTLLEILTFGNANGALTTIKRGAISALPTLLEVNKLINSLEGTEIILLDKANKALWENYEEVSKDPFRLNYHIMPPTNWMNDPIGLVQFKGVYHVFYQLHPYSAEWGPMHWGHVTSIDLIHWSHKPIALAPDKDYEIGCFSGSAVDNNGKLTLIYTAHDDNRKPKEVQCIAESVDGILFNKSLQNPVISELPKEASEDFRDPKVWKHNNYWYMIIGTGKSGKGSAVLYNSRDLESWSYLGVVCESNGAQGDIWECPDLFSLDEKDILMISPLHMENGKTIFIIGDMNYETNLFKQFKHQEVDKGDDFYAPQTFKDDLGRRILIGWMNMWGKKFPTQENGWMGAMTIPRTLSFDGDKVITNPVDELKQLRSNEFHYDRFLVEENNSNYINEIKGDSLEILTKIKIIDKSCKKFGLILRASKDMKQKTVLYYDVLNKQLVVDKSFSGLGDNNLNKADLLLAIDSTLELHVFIDKSSIEVFAKGGELVMSNRIYPDRQSINYDLFSEGGTTEVEYLYKWDLSSSWN